MLKKFILICGINYLMFVNIELKHDNGKTLAFESCFNF